MSIVDLVLSQFTISVLIEMIERTTAESWRLEFLVKLGKPGLSRLCTHARR